ncbi:MAG: hypothetical protein IKL47_14615 [Clostridia bacterium]|nr:hypothetical protein [Clostridia bacterium]
MNYEPKQIGKKAEKISLVLFFLAIVTVYLANAVVESMQWILQVATVGLLGVFIYILVRWSFTNFKYEIKARSKMETLPLRDVEAEKLQFYVHRSQGKRGYAAEFVCSVADIESVEKVSDGEKYKGKRFVFYRNMGRDNRYVVKIKDENETLFVFLEIGEEGKDFLEFLISKIAG